jgi:hypothetical protein
VAICSHFIGSISHNNLRQTAEPGSDRISFVLTYVHRLKFRLAFVESNSLLTRVLLSHLTLMFWQQQQLRNNKCESFSHLRCQLLSTAISSNTIAVNCHHHQSHRWSKIQRLTIFIQRQPPLCVHQNNG